MPGRIPVAVFERLACAGRRVATGAKLIFRPQKPKGRGGRASSRSVATERLHGLEGVGRLSSERTSGSPSVD